MPDTTMPTGMAGMLDSPDALIAAAARVRDAGYERWDCHTPYPVHGLDDAMGIKPSIMPYITIPAGLFGVAFAKTMQWYMSDFDFPLMIGGKPLFSLPAFVPVTFELFTLFAALATLGGVVVLCGLGKWHSPLHDAGLMAQVTSHRFCVYLDATDARFDAEESRKLLEEAGCSEVIPVFEEEEPLKA